MSLWYDEGHRLTLADMDYCTRCRPLMLTFIACCTLLADGGGLITINTFYSSDRYLASLSKLVDVYS